MHCSRVGGGVVGCDILESLAERTVSFKLVFSKADVYIHPTIATKDKQQLGEAEAQ